MERLFGLHPVREALRARRRRLHRLLLRDDRSQDEPLRKLAQQAEVAVETPGAVAFDRLLPTGARHQGLALEAEALPELTLEALLARLPEAASSSIVALDGVEDPRNVGAIARVAEGAGVAALLLTLRRAPPLSPLLSRASAGAIEHLPVARTPNLRRALGLLQQHGFWSLGADASAGDALFETPDRLWQGKLVVVLGAEGRGFRGGVSRALDHRVRIPMAGQVASLNVASAAALILYERLRREGLRPSPTLRTLSPDPSPGGRGRQEDTNRRPIKGLGPPPSP